MNTHAALLVMTMSAVTVLLRFLPFLLFRRKTPPCVSRLGEILPAAIIGMLSTRSIQAKSTDRIFFISVFPPSFCFVVYRSGAGKLRELARVDESAFPY